MTTDQLRAELARLLGFTAENLLRLSAVVAELESRGEDLTDLKIGLLPFLRQIAAGVLLPEVLVEFAGRPGVLRQLAARPVEEQRRVVAKELPAPEPKAWRRGPGRSPAGPHGSLSGDDSHAQVPEASRVAARGNPRDVGEMAAGLIAACPARDQAWQRMVDELCSRGVIGRAAADSLRSAVKPPPKRFSLTGEE